MINFISAFISFLDTELAMAQSQCVVLPSHGSLGWLKKVHQVISYGNGSSGATTPREVVRVQMFQKFCVACHHFAPLAWLSWPCRVRVHKTGRDVPAFSRADVTVGQEVVQSNTSFHNVHCFVRQKFQWSTEDSPLCHQNTKCVLDHLPGSGMTEVVDLPFWARLCPCLSDKNG